MSRILLLSLLSLLSLSSLSSLLSLSVPVFLCPTIVFRPNLLHTKRNITSPMHIFPTKKVAVCTRFPPPLTRYHLSFQFVIK